MLKKISWVIAALFVALAMIFTGCPTELAEGLDDGTGPVPEDDLVIEGKDVVLGKMGGNQAATTIDGNKVTFKDASATSVGFYYEFPREAEKYPNVIFYFKIVSASKGSVGLLIKNRDMSNYTGVTSDQDPQYQLNDVGNKEGWEFDTGLRKTSVFKDGQIGFQHQAWNPDGNGNVEYTIEVVKIVFPGSGSGDPKPTLGPKGVVFTPGKDADGKADASLDTIVDTSLAGTTYTLKSGTNFTYNFPTVAQNSANANNKVAMPVYIERDYDYVEIEYTISNIVTTSGGAGNAKVAFNQISGSNASYEESGGSWGDLGAAGNGTHQLQTWGSGGKGGFVIYFNSNDTKSSGCDSFDIKITKITFSKGTRYKVDFVSPQANHNSSIIILDGNKLGSRIPSVTVGGYTLFGWYEKWDKFGIVDLDFTSKDKILRSDGTTLAPDAGIMGSKATADTVISADTKLFAYWFSDILPPIVIEVGDGDLGGSDADGTLFEAVGNYASGTKVSYDDKEWWVVANANFAFDDLDLDDLDFTAADIAIIKAGMPAGQATRIGFTFPTDALVYDKIRFTYESIEIGENPGSSGEQETWGTIIRNNVGAGGGVNGTDKGYPWLNGESDNNPLTYQMSDLPNGVINIVKNKEGAFLLRITKVEFFFD